MDDPCYFNFHAVLRAHRAKVVGVPYGIDGPDMEAFAEVLATQQPRLYMTVSGLHNPTGASLSAIKAHRVLKLAEKHGVVIVEDDVFADLEDEPAPRLAGFDGFDRVIQVGSFSKTVSQALRCGYVVAKPDWIEPLIDLKLTMSLGNGHLAPAVVHRLLTDGSYRRHLDGLRAKLAGAMSSTIRRLGEIGIEPFLEPRAGLFLWAELPEGLDAADIARAALARDVIVAPGNVFSAGQRASRFLRFNVARCSEPRIYEVLAEAMREASSLGGRHEAIARWTSVHEGRVLRHQAAVERLADEGAGVGETVERREGAEAGTPLFAEQHLVERVEPLGRNARPLRSGGLGLEVLVARDWARHVVETRFERLLHWRRPAGPPGLRRARSAPRAPLRRAPGRPSPGARSPGSTARVADQPVEPWMAGGRHTRRVTAQKAPQHRRILAVGHRGEVEQHGEGHRRAALPLAGASTSGSGGSPPCRCHTGLPSRSRSAWRG